MICATCKVYQLNCSALVAVMRISQMGVNLKSSGNSSKLENMTFVESLQSLSSDTASSPPIRINTENIPLFYSFKELQMFIRDISSLTNKTRCSLHLTNFIMGYIQFD